MHMAIGVKVQATIATLRTELRHNQKSDTNAHGTQQKKVKHNRKKWQIHMEIGTMRRKKLRDSRKSGTTVHWNWCNAVKKTTLKQNIR